MSADTPLHTLAQHLVGSFDNCDQARENPTWFVPTCLWNRPLVQPIDGHLAIFTEQAPALDVGKPYRQRLLLLQPGTESLLRVEYRALRDPQAFAGAALEPQRLNGLSERDLTKLPGCILNVSQQGEQFVATAPEGVKCGFEYEGKIRQVSLGFEADARGFRSYDRGVDPETGRGLWGALMGAYEYVKREDFPLDATKP